jgi:Mycoplasma protein of unknown function, DUF285
MALMFCDDPQFNQDISSWDVSRSFQFAEMFKSSVPGTPHQFDQDISGWNTVEAAYMTGMFQNNNVSWVACLTP